VAALHLRIEDISPFVDALANNDNARRRVAKWWYLATTNVGFAIIVSHGMPPRMILVPCHTHIFLLINKEMVMIITNIPKSSART
jgi:hypothetical protein